MSEYNILVGCVAISSSGATGAAIIVLMKLLPYAASGGIGYEDVALVTLVIYGIVFLILFNTCARVVVRFLYAMGDNTKKPETEQKEVREVRFFANGKEKKPIRIEKWGG